MFQLRRKGFHEFNEVREGISLGRKNGRPNRKNFMKYVDTSLYVYTYKEKGGIFVSNVGRV